MSQDRLSSLVILSIEHKLVRQVDLWKIYWHCCSRKSKKDKLFMGFSVLIFERRIYDYVKWHFKDGINKTQQKYAQKSKHCKRLTAGNILKCILRLRVWSQKFSRAAPSEHYLPLSSAMGLMCQFCQRPLKSLGGPVAKKYNNLLAEIGWPWLYKGRFRRKDNRSPKSQCLYPSSVLLTHNKW